jgi:hypothetical protein
LSSGVTPDASAARGCSETIVSSIVLPLEICDATSAFECWP